MIQFIKLQKEHLAMVLEWRVNPEISQCMISDFAYSMENQQRWFKGIVNDDSRRYWVISYKDLPIGLINLAAIDRAHLRCSAGYYIGKAEYRQLGAMVPPYLYNYVFQEMKFRKIYGEVVGGNEKIMQIHKMHGFRQVGVYRDHVFKNGRFHDVILIELLSESWLKHNNYQRYIARFP